MGVLLRSTMRRAGVISRLLALSLAALAAGSGCSAIGSGRAGGEGGVCHIVLFWLKDGGNAEHRERIIETSRGFASIPGVLGVSVGNVVPSERAIVDDSFDVGLVMRFRDEKALADYLVHPKHEQAVRDLLLPLVERIVVHDFREAEVSRR